MTICPQALSFSTDMSAFWTVGDAPGFCRGDSGGFVGKGSRPWALERSGGASRPSSTQKARRSTGAVHRHEGRCSPGLRGWNGKERSIHRVLAYTPASCRRAIKEATGSNQPPLFRFASSCEISVYHEDFICFQPTDRRESGPACGCSRRSGHSRALLPRQAGNFVIHG